MCDLGVCYEAEVVATGVAKFGRFALSEQFAYWGTDEDGALVRRGKSGGLLEVLAGRQGCIHAVAVDAEHVYFSTLDAAFVCEDQPVTLGLFRVPLAGGDIAAPIVDNAAIFSAIQPTQDTIYVGMTGGLAAIERSSPHAFNWLATDGSVYEVAVRNNTVFWGSASGNVMRLASPDGTATVIGTAQIVYDIAVDDQHVYWMDASGPAAAIKKAPLEGGKATTVVQTQIVFLGGAGAEGFGGPLFCLDDEYIYYLDHDEGEDRDRIMRAPKVGGAPSLVTPHHRFRRVGAVAVDATHVYFSEFGGGGLFRVPK